MLTCQGCPLCHLWTASVNGRVGAASTGERRSWCALSHIRVAQCLAAGRVGLSRCTFASAATVRERATMLTCQGYPLCHLWTASMNGRVGAASTGERRSWCALTSESLAVSRGWASRVVGLHCGLDGDGERAFDHAHLPRLPTVPPVDSVREWACRCSLHRRETQLVCSQSHQCRAVARGWASRIFGSRGSGSSG